MRGFAEDSDRQIIDHLASELKVTSESLMAIGAAFSFEDHAWAFPMKDAYGNIIGIRLRDSLGKKWAIKGSKAGLFYGPSSKQRTAVVCEGPTDTAAALMIGLDAIGRASCAGQEALLVEKLRPFQRVLIVSDNDGPGIAGAKRLQPMLLVPSLLWCPPSKDLREFVNRGGTKELIDAMTKSLIWKMPVDSRYTAGVT